MEIEAKFTVPDRLTWEWLLAVPSLAGLLLGPVSVKHVHDRYLDTANADYLRGGFACRVRSSQGGRLVTLKGLGRASDGLHQRAELEVVLGPGDDESPAAWPECQAKDLALRLGGDQPLGLLFQAWQDRHIRLLGAEKRELAHVELSLDQVRLDRKNGVTFFELEAELLPFGHLDELYRLISVITTDLGLTPEPRSKFERGLSHTHPELQALLGPPLSPRKDLLP